MEAVLMTFLGPVLPYLLGKVEAGAEKAVDAFGAAAWERAQAIWHRLRPKVEAKEGAREAAEAVADDPDDPAARGAFQFQLRSMIAGDPELAAELERMLKEAQAAGVVAGDGSVIVQGDVRADRGGVAAGRDVVVGEGGIRTGDWRESDSGKA